MRCGISAAWVGFALIAAVIVFAVKSALVWNAVASLSASEVVQRYTLAIEDKEIQLLKSGFEKTAVLYSLMDTAKELGTHGGLSAKSLEKSDDNIYVKGASPPLRFEELCFLSGQPKECGSLSLLGPGIVREKIPYWVAPSTETSGCGTTKERVPYLRVIDAGYDIGASSTGTPGEAETNVALLGNVGNKYNQYFSEVNSGKYALYVSLEIFFLKPGEITVECGEGCVTLENAGVTASEPPTPPAKITQDKIYEYKITKVETPLPSILKVRLTAKDGTAGGDGKSIARLKQVVVSIYDASIDASGNKLRMVGAQNNAFTENLNKFQTSMQTALTAAGAGKWSKTTIGPLEGAFYRGYDNTVAGIVWSPEGIVSETQDYLGNDKLLTLRSSGVTEEEAKIRYWLMYDYAEKFARQADGVLKRRLWETLNTLKDTSSPTSGGFCGCDISPSCGLCPKDETIQYTNADIQNKVMDSLDSIAQEYIGLDKSFKWSLSLHSFEGCADKTNKDTAACDAAETCKGANFEHYEYKKGEFYYTGNKCPSRRMPCPGPYPCYYENYENKCTMEYHHRYVLKNLKVLVSIKDEQNKVFDPEKKDWAPLDFKFMVFVPLVDDNCCGTFRCDDFGSAQCVEPPVVKPAL